ncbi:unnamed protein product [Peniophora sp. CBMAI 1063]|nr:unnamed protein product [Peniophora sp. CBMAI 1063]
MLSLILPADDCAQFTRTLADELGDENEANVKFKKYGRRQVDFCVKFSVRASRRLVPVGVPLPHRLQLLRLLLPL